VARTFSMATTVDHSSLLARKAASENDATLLGEERSGLPSRLIMSCHYLDGVLPLQLPSGSAPCLPAVMQ